LIDLMGHKMLSAQTFYGDGAPGKRVIAIPER
jgi:hypothetical protein